jgi:hypothetical protein
MECRYNAVKYDMTVDEVEDILGEPTFSDFENEKIWSGESGLIVVSFEERHVSKKEFMPIRPCRRPFRR